MQFPDPASTLFLQFRPLCQRATTAMYTGMLGEEKLSGIKLVPTRELAEERANYRANTKALSRFFCGHVVPGRPIFYDSVDPQKVPSTDAMAQLKVVREAMADTSDQLRSYIRQYSEALVILPVATSQLTVCRFFSSNPRSRPVAAKMQKLLKQHQANLDESKPWLEGFEDFCQQRMDYALRLLNSTTVAERIGSELVAGRIAISQMSAVCDLLRQCLPQINKLNELMYSLRIYHASHNSKSPSQPLVRQILVYGNGIITVLKQIHESLGKIAYPFAHGKEGGITLANFIVVALPKANNPNDACAAAGVAIQRYHEVAFRALSVLTFWAEKAEYAANLQPLKEPAGNDEELQIAKATRSARHTRKYWIGYGVRAAAGIMLVTCLIYLSINPPELPGMPWGDSQQEGIHFRPAAFRLAYQPTGPTAPLFSHIPQIPFGYQGHMVLIQHGQPPVFAAPRFTPPDFQMHGPPTLHNMDNSGLPQHPAFAPNIPQNFSPPTPPTMRPFTPPMFNPGGMHSAGGPPSGGHR